jgi:hypothetical protein
MTRRAYVYFALTFLLGFAVGGASLFLYAWYGGHWRHAGGREHIVKVLTHDLGLSPEQVQQVNGFFDEADKKLSVLRRQVDPQFEAVRLETRDRIRKILRPDQAAKYDDLVRQYDERRKREQHH